MAMAGIVVLWVCCLPLACVMGQRDAIYDGIQTADGRYLHSGIDGPVSAKKHQEIVAVGGAGYACCTVVPLLMVLAGLGVAYAVAKT